MNEIWIETIQDKIFGMTAGAPQNPAVIGLHGRSQRNGWHTWEPLAQPLAEAGFYVILFDMPGWGQSAARDGFDPAGIVLAIMNSLDIQTTSLLGKSWGGGIAIELALNHADKIEKLVLTAPAIRGGVEELARLTKPVLLAWAKDDPVFPFEYAAVFCDTIPNCQLESYETGGHSAAMKNAENFAPKAVGFLKEQRVGNW